MVEQNRSDSLSHTIETGGIRSSLEDELRTDIETSERVITIVSETIPATLYGNVALTIAQAGPTPVSSRGAFDVAIGLNYSFLHQYLHAIPPAGASLTAPATDSPYATDTTAAVLDGDLLQACSFRRTLSSHLRPAHALACYQSVAEASIECYERIAEHGVQSATSLFPLFTAAVRIGGLLGEFDRVTVAEMLEPAQAVGTALPIRMPAGTVSVTDTDIGNRLQEIGLLVSDSSELIARLEEHVVNALPSKSARH